MLAANSSVPPLPVLLGKPLSVYVQAQIAGQSYQLPAAAATAHDASEVPQPSRVGGWKCSWCLTPEVMVLRGDAHRMCLLPWFYRNSLLHPAETC